MTTIEQSIHNADSMDAKTFFKELFIILSKFQIDDKQKNLLTSHFFIVTSDRNTGASRHETKDKLAKLYKDALGDVIVDNKFIISFQTKRWPAIVTLKPSRSSVVFNVKLIS